jgi:hypothetical protein
MRWLPTSVLICTAIALVALADRGLAAPVPKEKKAEAPGPVTPEQLAESKANLELIAIAIHNYHDTYKVLPTNQLSNDKKPLLSWRVQILPFIERNRPLTAPDVPFVPEENALFKQFKLDEPWDSDHNKKLIEKMPKIYAPVRGKFDPGMTFYQAFGGSNGWLKPGAKFVGSFPDGMSNTLLAAEAAKPVIWTKPDDLVFNGKDVPGLGGLFDGKFHAAMGSGEVERFRKGIEADTLKRLIDPADGKGLPGDYGLDRDEKK